MNRSEIFSLMQAILQKQGLSVVINENSLLRDIGFRSLDFSELALRIERGTGRELNFDAGRLRQISSVGDVLNFFLDAIQEK